MDYKYARSQQSKPPHLPIISPSIFPLVALRGELPQQPSLQPFSPPPSVESKMGDRISIVLPDLLKFCPTKPATNVHYEAVRSASIASVRSFHLFSEERQAKFEANLFEYFMSIAHPNAGEDSLRLCVDDAVLFYVNDTMTDYQELGDAGLTCDTLVDAFSNPHNHDGSNYARYVAEYARL